MINVIFYNFNKKINSTAQPVPPMPADTVSETYQCVLKDGTSLLSPTIELRGASFDDAPSFNYCYIEALNKRYYYVTNIYWAMGTWLFDLSCDVLATYKASILASSQYVLRASEDYDDDILDAFYTDKIPSGGTYSYSEYAGITKLGINYPYGVEFETSGGTTGYSTDYFNKTALNLGTYVVGIVAGGSTGVTYYSFLSTPFNDFVNKVASLQPSNMASVDRGIANAIYNPFQYVVSVKWYPESAAAVSGSSTDTIKIGSDSVNLSTGNTATRINRADIETFSAFIDIPKHPLSTNRNYLNMSPWTEMSLYFEPFGLIPIDTTKILNATSIWLKWSVDYGTGTAILKVSTSPTMHNLIYYGMAEYGVEIPISSLVMDWKAGAIVAGVNYINKNRTNNTIKGFIGGMMASASNIVGHGRYKDDGLALTERYMSSSGKLVDAIVDATAASLGQLQVTGSVGSFLAYTNKNLPALIAHYMDPTEEDISRFGRPLCKVKTLSALSGGFVLCQDASISSYRNNTNQRPPLNQENTIILNYLNTGVYLE